MFLVDFKTFANDQPDNYQNEDCGQVRFSRLYFLNDKGEIQNV